MNSSTCDFHPPPGDTLLCGWRVRSALPLPELPPWPGPEATAPDITIVEATVPERLDDPVNPGRFLMVGADGSVLLHIKGLVRLLVQDGCKVTVEILRRDTTDSWRLFLLGAALGYLCHQRGLLPLHAATLRVGRHTLAVAGHSGTGKSTLALELVRRGHQLLSDDVTVLRVTPGTGAEVLPAFPRLKLWRATLDALGIAPAGLKRVREGMEKYDLRPTAIFDPTPSRLDGIVFLGDGPAPTLVARPPAVSVPVVHGYVVRARVARLLGRQATLFAQAGAIAATVPIYRLDRPKRFDALAAMAALIEERFAS